MVRTQKGFTLIELVMVIVILGILAAVAIPRYIDLSTSARVSSVNGMLATVNGAAAITNAQAIISAATGTGPTTITVGGTPISTAFGFPVATTGGIDNAVANMTGFTFASPGKFELIGAPNSTNCSVTYTNATTVGGMYSTSTTTSGC